MPRLPSRSTGALDFAALSQWRERSLFLLQGNFVSLHYSHQKPTVWSEQKHAEAEVMVLFAPAVCHLRWRSGGEAGSEVTIRGPAVCLIPPGLSHVPRWECEAELIVLYLDLVLFKPIDGGVKVLNSLDEPTFFTADDLIVWPFFSSLRHLLRLHSSLEKGYLDALGTVAAGHLFRGMYVTLGENVSATTLSRQKLRSITDYIQANLARPLQVQDLANKAGVSRTHFAEVFKNTTRFSPYEYITRCRVLRAQDLLATGELRIREVAEAVGFCDQSHLTRHFKKLLGYSPKVEATRGRESQIPS